LHDDIRVRRHLQKHFGGAGTFEIEHELDIGLPTIRKHLRVGIDSAHAVNAALAELLIRKGLITRSDYEESIRLLMNNELALYEERINATYQTGSRLNFR